MRLLLAPMEGLLDEVLRAVLTHSGGYDYAVTEFARVSGTVLPARFFRRLAPELNTASRTLGGTPVHVQLLGSDPACMGESAAQLASLAPAGVDLNFGCPAQTVNRHRGGAVLLDDPELLHRIAVAVRAAVPATIALSAKMRLGVTDTGRALECAQALSAGGAGTLVVHARTKADGYRPPAHWQRCRAVSGVADVMLGRGAVADPFLASRIRAGRLEQPDAEERAREWATLLPLLALFRERVKSKVAARHAPGRIKQWLHLLARNYPQAQQLFATLRSLRTLAEVEAALVVHGVPLAGEQAEALAEAA